MIRILRKRKWTEKVESTFISHRSSVEKQNNVMGFSGIVQPLKNPGSCQVVGPKSLVYVCGIVVRIQRLVIFIKANLLDRGRRRSALFYRPLTSCMYILWRHINNKTDPKMTWEQCQMHRMCRPTTTIYQSDTHNNKV